MVTGAGGFIGSHLVEQLAARGAAVVALIHTNAGGRIGHLAELPERLRAQIEIRDVDLADAGLLASAFEGCDTVFHLAAQVSVPFSVRAPTLFVQTNIVGTHNVLMAAAAARCGRVVVMSSSEVYGAAATFPIREDAPLCARSTYAATKIAAEKLAEGFFHTRDMGVVIMRPFNTFGPRQSLRAVIPYVASAALAGGAVRLGNLDPVRDFVYVGDTARGLLCAGEAPGVEGMTFNLATGRGVSIGELVRIVGAAVGRELPVEVTPGRVRREQSEVWRLEGDAGRAAERLGWRPEVTLEEGVRAVLEDVRRRGLPGELR